MQSAECLKALDDFNIHAALVGSPFEDKGMFTVLLITDNVVHCTILIQDMYIYNEMFKQLKY